MFQPYQVVQAYDRALIKEMSADDAAGLETKLEAAFRLRKDHDGALKPHQRSAILIRAAVLLGERLDAFARLIAKEGGKPLTDARIEAVRAVDGLCNAGEEIRNFAGREIPDGAHAGERWTLGFHHPGADRRRRRDLRFQPSAQPDCPSGRAGHRSWVSRDRQAGCADAAVLPGAGRPAEGGRSPRAVAPTLVTEDNALSERLATDPRVAFFSFIGSARVGWHLRSKLAPGMRCALEHGGAAPVVIDRSAKLDRIIEPIVKGGYHHAGQVCVSTQRIFVHSDTKAQFVERLAARVRALRVGNPLLADTEVGPLILPREATRVSRWIEEAVSGGAQLIGGGRLSDTALMPAILVEPAADAKVSQLEIFGSMTSVHGFETLDDAIAIANSLPFAFQASVFSTDIGPALRVAKRLDASAVMINDHTAFRTDWMPFAGRRQSGHGVGGIRPTMDEMSEEKMLVFRHAD